MHEISKKGFTPFGPVMSNPSKKNWLFPSQSSIFSINCNLECDKKLNS